MQQPAPCRFLIIIFLRKRQAENKFRSHALGTDNIDIFIMRLDYFPRDGEPQAGALLILAPGKIRFIETIPDQLQAVLGNADAAVLYGDEYLVPFFCGFNLDNGIGMGKFDSIVHQVVEYLLYFAHIRVHGKLFAGKDKLNGDMLLLAGALKGCRRIANDGVDVKVRFFQNHALGVQVVQGEQAVSELGEPFSFV